MILGMTDHILAPSSTKVLTISDVEISEFCGENVGYSNRCQITTANSWEKFFNAIDRYAVSLAYKKGWS